MISMREGSVAPILSTKEAHCCCLPRSSTNASAENSLHHHSESSAEPDVQHLPKRIVDNLVARRLGLK